MRRRPGDPPGGGGWEYWGFSEWVENLFYSPREKDSGGQSGSWIDWLLGDVDAIVHSSANIDGVSGYLAPDMNSAAIAEGGMDVYKNEGYPWPAEALGACAVVGMAMESSESGGDLALGGEGGSAMAGETGTSGATEAA